MPYEIPVFFVCLLLSAFFSGSETALLAASRLKLQRLASHGDRRAASVLELRQDPRSMLAGILVGNNLVNVLAAALATTYFEGVFHGPAGIVVATVVTTVLLVVLSEYLPKSVAAHHPLDWSRTVVAPIRWVLRLLKPVVLPLEWISAPLRKGNHAQSHVALADFGVLVTEGVKSGTVNATMERVLRGGLSLEWKTAADILIPRVDVSTVAADADYASCCRSFRDEKVSRLLVIGSSIDEDVGYIAARDVLLLSETEQEGWTASNGARDALRVPGGLKLPDLLHRMRREGVHFAVVKDEYGGTAGIVTLEDVLEELVGEIRDEHDDDERAPIRPIAEDAWAVRGDVAVRELEERLGLRIGEEESRTIGGLVPAELGRIPRVGDAVERPGARIEVTEVTENRVREVRLERRKPPEDKGGPES
ncbi:MAG: hemolysin family protein [Planctomycetota bacterium]